MSSTDTRDALVDDPRLTAFGLLAETKTGISAAMATQLQEHALSPLEFEVLLRLARSDRRRLRMADLAAQVMMSASGLTRVVDRLEADGLVARGSCPGDRRGTFAILTEAGLARLVGALPGHLRVIDRWYTGVLTATEVETLTSLLRKLRDVVRPDAVAGGSADQP